MEKQTPKTKRLNEVKRKTVKSKQLSEIKKSLKKFQRLNENEESMNNTDRKVLEEILRKYSIEKINLVLRALVDRGLVVPQGGRDHPSNS